MLVRLRRRRTEVEDCLDGWLSFDGGVATCWFRRRFFRRSLVVCRCGRVLRWDSKRFGGRSRGGAFSVTAEEGARRLWFAFSKDNGRSVKREAVGWKTTWGLWWWTQWGVCWGFVRCDDFAFWSAGVRFVRVSPVGVRGWWLKVKRKWNGDGGSGSTGKGQEAFLFSIFKSLCLRPEREFFEESSPLCREDSVCFFSFFFFVTVGEECGVRGPLASHVSLTRR